MRHAWRLRLLLLLLLLYLLVVTLLVLAIVAWWRRRYYSSSSLLWSKTSGTFYYDCCDRQNGPHVRIFFRSSPGQRHVALDIYLIHVDVGVLFDQSIRGVCTCGYIGVRQFFFFSLVGWDDIYATKQRTILCLNSIDWNRFFRGGRELRVRRMIKITRWRAKGSLRIIYFCC